MDLEESQTESDAQASKKSSFMEDAHNSQNLFFDPPLQTLETAQSEDEEAAKMMFDQFISQSPSQRKKKLSGLFKFNKSDKKKQSLIGEERPN